MQTTAVAGALELLAANATIDCLYRERSGGGCGSSYRCSSSTATTLATLFLRERPCRAGAARRWAGLASTIGVWMSQAMPSPYTSTSDAAAAKQPRLSWLPIGAAHGRASFRPTILTCRTASIEGYLSSVSLIAAAMTSDPEQTPDSWLSEPVQSLGPAQLGRSGGGPIPADSATLTHRTRAIHLPSHLHCLVRSQCDSIVPAATRATLHCHYDCPSPQSVCGCRSSHTRCHRRIRRRRCQQTQCHW